MKCRHCNNLLKHIFLDLGSAPPSNAYLNEKDLYKPEINYPLRVYVCASCWLVQTEDYTQAEELFSPSYAYFSSTSKSWLQHAENYCDMIEEKFSLDASSFVLEVAANDGYLLKNFVNKGIPCVGIEPTDSTAEVAENLNIPILRKFFSQKLGEELAKNGDSADLVICNNVYAHVPDINDFTLGLKSVLKPGGVVTLEFPHLMKLIECRQFDTVYHEHFSYLSLNAVSKIFKKCGLRIFDVEKLSTHGGSLRVYGCRNDAHHEEKDSVATLMKDEINQGAASINLYEEFQMYADKIKNDLLIFLLERKKSGSTIAGYGAAAKGNTLLNYAGVRPDLLNYICDASVSKQGKYMPGSRIPILSPNVISERKPEYVLILPWNLEKEIKGKLGFIREWGGKFVTAVPSLRTS